MIRDEVQSPPTLHAQSLVLLKYRYAKEVSQCLSSRQVLAPDFICINEGTITLMLFVLEHIKVESVTGLDAL